MISKRCHYALLAMLELAQREGKGPVTIGDIATARGIPVRFLEAILRQLKQAGFADSLRGKEGGYFLALPADRIPVGGVVRVFEGSLAGGAPGVGGAGADVLQDLWREAEEALAAVYRRVSFRELAERETLRLQSHAANYTI